MNQLKFQRLQEEMEKIEMEMGIKFQIILIIEMNIVFISKFLKTNILINNHQAG